MDDFKTHSDNINNNHTQIELLKSDVKHLMSDHNSLKEVSALESIQIERFTEIENMLMQFNNSIDQVKNSILTTDNYVDKYLGFKMIKNLMETLKEIYEESPDPDDLSLVQQSSSKI